MSRLLSPSAASRATCSSVGVSAATPLQRRPPRAPAGRDQLGAGPLRRAPAPPPRGRPPARCAASRVPARAGRLSLGGAELGQRSERTPGDPASGPPPEPTGEGGHVAVQAAVDAQRLRDAPSALRCAAPAPTARARAAARARGRRARRRAPRPAPARGRTGDGSKRHRVELLAGRQQTVQRLLAAGRRRSPPAPRRARCMAERCWDPMGCCRQKSSHASSACPRSMSTSNSASGKEASCSMRVSSSQAPRPSASASASRPSRSPRCVR